MVCQKERHADPILPFLKVSQPVTTDGGIVDRNGDIRRCHGDCVGVVVAEKA